MTKLDFTKGRKRKPYSVRGSFLVAFSVAGTIYLSASSAFALSCMAPDLISMRDHHVATGQDYLLVRGSLSVGGTPAVSSEEEGSQQHIAHIEAVVIEGGENGDIFDEEVPVEVSCIGPWCGTVAPVESAFIFLTKNVSGNWSISQGPCGGQIFNAPTEEEIFRVLDDLGI